MNPPIDKGGGDNLWVPELRHRMGEQCGAAQVLDLWPHSAWVSNLESILQGNLLQCNNPTTHFPVFEAGLETFV